MAHTVAQKLRIREGARLLTINAPAGFSKGLQGIPAGVKIVSPGKGYDQVHWFVNNRAQLEKEMEETLKLLKENVILWIYYPKGSSKLQTDLTRDKGWDRLLKQGNQLTWISLVSFDATWSVFGCRLKTEADKRKLAKPREIFNWVDPQTKTVRLPGDLLAGFGKHKRELAVFESLSFSHKKEYLEWILTAKRAETRAERIKGTIERLGNGWKNPRNM